MSSSKKAFGGLFWTTLYNILNGIYTVAAVPILYHHFGRDQYGLIGLAFSLNAYLAIMDFGFSTGNIRFFSQWIARKQYDRVSKLFQSSMAFYGSIGLINVAILAIMAFFAKTIWHLQANQLDIVHNLFYILMVSAFFGWISTLFDQYLKANEIIGWEERLMIFIKIIWILILYLTIKNNYSVVRYVMLTCFSSLLILPFTIIRMRNLPIKVKFFPRYYPVVFKQILPYSLATFMMGFFQFSASGLRPILLSFKADIGAVSDFRILSGIGSFFALISGSFVGVLLPMATKAVTLGNRDTRDKIAYDATKYLTIFLSLTVFCFVLVSRDLLQLYIGKNMDYLVPWLNMWMLCLLFSHNSAISSLVFAENKLRPLTYMSAFSAITSLTISWFLIPRYQVGALVIGYLCYCISQISFCYIFYYRKVLKLNVARILIGSFFKPALPICVCGLITYFIMNYIQVQNGYLRIVTTGLAFLALAAPIIYFILLDRNDRTFIFGLFKKNNKEKIKA